MLWLRQSRSESWSCHPNKTGIEQSSHMSDKSASNMVPKKRDTSTRAKWLITVVNDIEHFDIS